MGIDVAGPGRSCETAMGGRGFGSRWPLPSGARWPSAGLVVLLMLSVGGPVMAQGGADGRRVALVVGNDAYQAQGVLRNAVNDARAVASALGEVGFAVTRVENADRARLTSALAEFARSLRSDDVALFYFAGHGVQVDQENYLMPTDYAGQTASALRFDAVSASDVQEMLRPARMAMLVFDACRNNPYRGVRGGTGLAPMEARGTLIAYAAGAGEVAADAAPGASNGLFTSKFVEALREPGLTASAMFMRVRREVVSASNEEQWPAVYNDLLSDFVFRPSATVAVGPTGDPLSVVAADGVAATVRAQQETVFWQSIQGSTDPADFEAYLELFPNGTFSRLARNRLPAPGGPAGDASPGADPPRDGPGGGEVFRDCPSCPELVVIPAGEFWMGSPASEQGRNDDEGPQRQVRVERFALGRYEVTRGEYAAFAAATGRDGDRCYVFDGDDGFGWSDRASWLSPGFPQTDDHPAVCVSWDDARAYARWLSGETRRNYRLPSESEWEYAARGGTTMSRYWGDGSSGQCGDANGADAAAKQRFGHWTVASCNDGRVFTSPVGTFAANGFGLFDVLGNVSEWVEDCWHDSYRGAPSDGRAWTGGGDCGRRVSRGGSWYDTPRLLRAASRDRLDAGFRVAYVGFRLARTLD